MRWNKIDLNMDTLKTQALALKQKLTDPETTAKAKELGTKAWEYAKENPDDIFLGVIAFTLLDIEDSLEDIENASEVSAHVDASTYLERY